MIRVELLTAKRARVRHLLVMVLTLCACWMPYPAAYADEPEIQEWQVQVEVNRQIHPDTFVVLQQSGGAILVLEADWKQLRLKMPSSPSILVHEQRYFPLAAVPELRFRLDQSRLLLIIDAPGESLLPTLIATPADSSPKPKADTGFFLNYDALASYQDQEIQLSSAFEAGVFSDFGAMVGSFVARDVLGRNDWVRLDTTYIRDFPENLSGLRIGDGISRPGAWGTAARFGGIQYATNFATQPQLITQPLRSIVGEAALPSTIDLYLNGMRTMSRDIAPGPFEITDLPIVSGYGELRMVTRDILGREVIVDQPFYGTPRLLRAGFDDYSFEVGMLRRNFGNTSADYGDALLSGTFRRGFSDQLTGEVHGEWVSNQVANAGFSADFLLGSLGVANLASATGSSRLGQALLFQSGLQIQPWSALNLGAQWQWTNGKLLRAGSEQAAPLRQFSANVGYTFGPGASLGLSYIRQQDSIFGKSEVLAGNFNFNLSNWASITLGAQVFLADRAEYTVGLGLTVPLGERNFVTTRADWRQRGPENATVRAIYTQSPPYGEGIGYRFETASNNRHAASFTHNMMHGTYQLDALVSDGTFAARAGGRGGFAILGDEWFAMRRIDQSFAMVQVSDLAGVRVYADNQLLGRTDSVGRLLIPRLRPYQRNPISIEPLDLPLDVEIDALRVDVTPFFRSGVVVNFPVRRVRGGLLTIVLEDGTPIPAGATVRVLPDGQNHPVARQGQVYLTGLDKTNRLEARWKNQSCEFNLSYPDTGDPLPDLKEVTCRGLSP